MNRSNRKKEKYMRLKQGGRCVNCSKKREQKNRARCNKCLRINKISSKIYNSYNADKKHYICYFCEKKFYSRYNNARLCSYKCANSQQSIDRTGNKHPLWIEDRTQVKGNIQNYIRSSPSGVMWTKQILHNYDYICQLCGQRGGKLNAHHIIKLSDLINSLNDIQLYNLKNGIDIPEHVFDLNNGVCLCEKCHLSIKNNENKYIEYFMLLSK